MNNDDSIGPLGMPQLPKETVIASVDNTVSDGGFFVNPDLTRAGVERDVKAAADNCDAVLADIKSQLDAWVGVCRLSCDNIDAACRGCLESAVSRARAKADSVTDKCRQTVLEKFDQSVGTVDALINQISNDLGLIPVDTTVPPVVPPIGDGVPDLPPPPPPDTTPPVVPSPISVPHCLPGYVIDQATGQCVITGDHPPIFTPNPPAVPIPVLTPPPDTTWTGCSPPTPSGPIPPGGGAAPDPIRHDNGCPPPSPDTREAPFVGLPGNIVGTIQWVPTGSEKDPDYSPPYTLGDNRGTVIRNDVSIGKGGYTVTTYRNLGYCPTLPVDHCEPPNLCPPCPPPPQPPTADAHPLADYCSPKTAQIFVEAIGNFKAPAFSLGDTGVPVPDCSGEGIAGTVVCSIWNAGKSFFGWVANLFGSIYNASDGLIKGITGCKNDGFAQASKGLFVLGWIQRWLGNLPPMIMSNLNYGMNAACQYLIPSSAEIHVLRNRDYITDKQWEAGVKMNGDCVPWQESLKDAGQFRVNPLEAVAEHARQKLSDDEYDTLLKRLGVQDKKQRELLEDMFKQRPGMGDIIRMMVRDVDDQTVVDQYFLDKEFHEKFQEQLKTWATDQGIDEKIALYNWRAHWKFPSDSQLYEMLHRYRPGRKKSGGQFDDIDITQEDIEDAVRINDMVPYFVRPIIGLSYIPYTRRDLQALQCYGILDDDEITEAWQDLGYDKDKAEKQTKLLKAKNAGKACAGQLGISAAEILKMYGSDGIDRQTAVDLLQQTGYEYDDAEQLTYGVDTKVRAKRRTECIAGLKRRFMRGDLDTDQAHALLEQAGVVGDQTDNLVIHWQCVLKGKSKEASVAQLCEWFSRGLLSASDYVRRLTNLGYDTDDALRIFNVCVAKLKEKQDKEAAKAQKELEDRKRKEEMLAAAKACRTKAAAAKNPLLNGAAS